MSDDGYLVHNIGQSGNSNLDAVTKIDIGLSTARACNQPVSKVFVFQTEWTRDFSRNHINVFDWFAQENLLFESIGYCLNPTDNFFDLFKINTPTDLATRVIQNFYAKLSELSARYNVEFYIIGGCADAIDYTIAGVQVVCQSMTNLILTGQPLNNRPVYSYYHVIGTQNWLKKQFPNHLSELIDFYDRSEKKCHIMGVTPELFWPDGRHPNKNGHLILYNFLKTQNCFN